VEIGRGDAMLAMLVPGHTKRKAITKYVVGHEQSSESPPLSCDV